jgi:heterotetrameric sarcosine oxidase delta subunit
MLILPCPACGPRPEGEFVCLGEAVAPRPDPATLTDAEWVDYTTNRANTRGPHRERWWHVRSCGLIITVERDTLTHDVRALPEDMP